MAMIQPGKLVLVEFAGGSRNKTRYKYICCVQKGDDYEGEIFVTGYQCKDKISTKLY